MATNLVSQIVEALGPTSVSRIASSFDDQAFTKKRSMQRCRAYLRRLFRWFLSRKVPASSPMQ